MDNPSGILIDGTGWDAVLIFPDLSTVCWKLRATNQGCPLPTMVWRTFSRNRLLVLSMSAMALTETRRRSGLWLQVRNSALDTDAWWVSRTTDGGQSDEQNVIWIFSSGFITLSKELTMAKLIPFCLTSSAPFLSFQLSYLLVHDSCNLFFRRWRKASSIHCHRWTVTGQHWPADASSFQ